MARGRPSSILLGEPVAVTARQQMRQQVPTERRLHHDRLSRTLQHILSRCLDAVPSGKLWWWWWQHFGSPWRFHSYRGTAQTPLSCLFIVRLRSRRPRVASKLRMFTSSSPSLFAWTGGDKPRLSFQFGRASGLAMEGGRLTL